MNSPENNGRREFLKQAVSSVATAPTYGFLLNKIKFDTPGTPDYQETVDKMFEIIEEQAKLDRGISGAVSNIKANLRKLQLQIEVYKKGAAKCSKEDILDCLDQDYYCAQQTPGAEDMLIEIDRMTERVRSLN